MIAFLAAKTSVDRIELGRALRNVEGSIAAIALLESACGAGASVSPSSDDFFEGIEQGNGWCHGTTAEVLKRTDPYRSYAFTGGVRVGAGLVFRWTRGIEPSAREQQTETFLRKSEEISGRDNRGVAWHAAFAFDDQTPLLKPHVIWVSTTRVEPLPLGEFVRAEGWYAGHTDGQDAPVMRTAEELRLDVADIGAAVSATGSDALAVYRSLLLSWNNQLVKVPVLNLDLRYSFAIVTLASIALVQMVVFAASLARSQPNQLSEIAERLSIRRQWKAANRGLMVRILLFCDWLIVVAWFAVSVAAPLACSVSIAMVRDAVGVERNASIIVHSIAGISLAIVVYAFRKALQIAGASYDTAAPVSDEVPT